MAGKDDGAVGATAGDGTDPAGRARVGASAGTIRTETCTVSPGVDASGTGVAATATDGGGLFAPAWGCVPGVAAV